MNSIAPLRFGFVCFLLSAGLATGAFAQGSVWVVDDGGGAGVAFTNIQPAIDAAADGDTILVKDGFYGPFTIANKTLVVTSEVGATVVVQGGIVVGPLGASQAAAIRGILEVQVSGVGAVITQCAGPVWFESCSLRGHAAPIGTVHADDGSAAARVGSSGAVSFTRCSFSGGNGGPVSDLWPDVPGVGGSGLDILAGSSVALYDCTLKGGIGGYAVWNQVGAGGGPGLDLKNGFLLASGTSIEGGAGGKGGHISLTSSWCDDGGPGGDGLLLGSPSSIAKILGCAFTGGAGGPGGTGGTGCTAGANGLPVDDLGGSFTDLGGAARSFNATSPVRELHDSTFTFEGAPGELAFVLYSPAQSSIYFEPFKGMLLPNLLYADVYTAGTLSPAGELTVTVTVPALPPTIQGGTYFLQSLFFDPSTGALLIGAPSALAILSASL